jgi:antitoxin (DNA-binding transcriptional repressor) of toxin-antitoxin stability system
MRASDGHLSLVQVAATDNPSYLALDPTRTHLYCTNQNKPVARLTSVRRYARARIGTHVDKAVLVRSADRCRLGRSGRTPRKPAYRHDAHRDAACPRERVHAGVVARRVSRREVHAADP